MRVSWLIEQDGGQAGWVARADARAKIAVSLLASCLTVALGSAVAQAVLFAGSACCVLSLRRPRLVLVSYLFVSLMFVLAAGCAALMHALVPRLPGLDPAALAVPFLRLLVMVNVLLPLAFSTRFQALLTALKSLRLPFCLYLPLAVMIRFIPTFCADLRQIGEALRLRGYRLGWKEFARHPALFLRFVGVPLLFRALKASDDLGIAAELKGLGAERRPRPYRALCWSRRDSLIVGLAALVCLAALGCHLLLAPAATGVMR